MTVRDTSILAYTELQPKLGQKQAVAYNIIKAYPDHTDLEYCNLLGYPDPNMFRPRRKELYDQKLVVESGRRACSVSKHLAYTWRVNKQ